MEEGRLQRWRSLPLSFVLRFWRAVDFVCFCTQCTRLFSSPLPVLSRIHWGGDRAAGRGWFFTPSLSSSPSQGKKKTINQTNHILSSFGKKKALDNWIFNVLFFYASVWLNRTYWSRSLLNRAVDYCAPSMLTKKKNPTQKQQTQTKMKTKSSLFFFFLAKFGSVENGNSLGQVMALFDSFVCVPKKIQERP